MTTTAEQIRSYRGPVLFSYGFRPFFLFAAVWAALAVALWLPMLTGHLTLPTAMTPIEWHVHELVYGYVPAVVAGFLLTAVPNWTGRLPVVGAPLAWLFGCWLAGRLAIATSAWIGAAAAAAIDVAFLLALGAVIAREIVASGNTRNLKVLAGVGLLLAGNVLFHVEAIDGAGAGYGMRLGIAAAILLIMLIGGRIIPSFTRNWLIRRGAGRLPAAFDQLDVVVMIASAAALALWVVLPAERATASVALAAMAMNLLRLARWAGERTAAEPLVLVLHVAYAFVPAGFGLLALGILAPGVVAPTGAVHGFTAGAIALMTLAVMTRASLGHTGQALTASPPIQAIYAAALVAALARLLAAFDVLREPMLHLSAAAWVLAFGGFVVVYGPLLARRRTA
ncbi:MAG: NnrS family protein [Reyranella sp.]|uniref:NnrS family protein n=1 Tax=Reyranella sp. TaxID=1929291 RepID=UPI003D0ECE64